MEPHMLLKLAYHLDQWDLVYFQPLMERTNISIHHGRLSASGGALTYTQEEKTASLKTLETSKLEADYVWRREKWEKERPGKGQTDQRSELVFAIDKIQVSGGDLGSFNLRQIFLHHLFHTDPHSGNVFLLPGNRIAVIDFGQAMEISGRTRKLIMEWFAAFFKRDVHEMLRVFVHEEMVGEQTDVDGLSLDVEELFNYYFSFPGDDIPFTEFLTDNMALFRMGLTLYDPSRALPPGPWYPLSGVW